MACRKCGQKKLEYAFGHCKECATQAKPDAFYCHDHKKNVDDQEAKNCAMQGHILGEIQDGPTS